MSLSRFVHGFRPCLASWVFAAGKGIVHNSVLLQVPESCSCPQHWQTPSMHILARMQEPSEDNAPSLSCGPVTFTGRAEEDNVRTFSQKITGTRWNAVKHLLVASFALFQKAICWTSLVHKQQSQSQELKTEVIQELSNEACIQRERCG